MINLNKSLNVLLAISVLFGILFRLYNINYENLWFDEIATFWVTDPNISLTDMFERNRTTEGAPYFYYILVYYWVLRHPQNLGYGFIFLAGLVNDVVFGFPLGINSLSLLVIAGMAAYVRVVTVRITLTNDWISFVPALLVANFVYFISLSLTNHSIDYFFLFQNSLATFIFYPLLWMFFSVILKIIKS